MIIFNNANDLINSLIVEKETLEFRLNSQEKTKEMLLNYIQNFADSNDNIDLSSVDNVVVFLTDLKNSLNLCNENISYLSNLLENINGVIDCANNNIPEFKKTLDQYNIKYIDSNKHVLENNVVIENCLFAISKRAEIIFEEIKSLEGETQSSVNPAYNQESKTESTQSNNSNNNVQVDNTVINAQAQDGEDSNYKENTLIVSERSGNVILPYKISELNEILEKEPNRYFSIDSIIAKKYTLPIKLFKNSFISRFREAFKLMRHKEKASIRDALDLGLELMFYYKLHPAIISACKNLEELDTYLDCLEIGRVDRFDCFKIIFELPLAVAK